MIASDRLGASVFSWEGESNLYVEAAVGLFETIADGWREWIRAYRTIPTARAIDRAIALRDAGQILDARESAAAIVAELVSRRELGGQPYRAGFLVVSACLHEQLSDELGMEALPVARLRKVVDIAGAVGPLPSKYADQLSWLRSRLPR